MIPLLKTTKLQECCEAEMATVRIWICMELDNSILVLISHWKNVIYTIKFIKQRHTCTLWMIFKTQVQCLWSDPNLISNRIFWRVAAAPRDGQKVLPWGNYASCCWSWQDWGGRVILCSELEIIKCISIRGKYSHWPESTLYILYYSWLFLLYR